MAKFKKKRIPVLNDIVNHDDDPPSTGRVPDSNIFDALVDSLQQDLVDRVTRSLHEVIAREEASMRTAIRAHLEVMLPEIMEQWQREYQTVQREAKKKSARTLHQPLRFGRDYPGALEPMVAIPPEHRNPAKTTD